MISTKEFSDIPVPIALHDVVGGESWETMEDFLSLFTELPGNHHPKEEFVEVLFSRLALQHQDNIPWYVSHGADHNIRTVAIAQRLMDVMPELGLIASKKYGIKSAEFGEFLILVGVLLHDIGYPDLANHPSLPKFLHAEVGARMVSEIFQKELMDEVFDFLGESENQYIEDLISAIRYHNADHPEHLNNPRIEVLPVSTVYLQKDESVKRPYQAAAARQDPILFVVRIADNLDAQYNRLTPIQRKEWFQALHHSITTDESFKQESKGLSRGSNEIQTLLKRHYSLTAKSIASQFEIGDPNSREIIQFTAEFNQTAGISHQPVGNAQIALLNAKPGDFPHFFSNWVIAKTQFDRSDTGELLLDVQFKDSIIKVRPGVAVYQLVRAADATHSCTLDGKPFTDMLVVKTNKQEYFLGHTRLNLSIFASDNDVYGNPISPDPVFTQKLITK